MSAMPLRSRFPFLLLAGAALAPLQAEEIPIAGSSTAAFASVEEGQTLLGQADEYIRRMGAFDRMLRMDREAPASEREFRDFVAEQVTAWPADERKRVEAVLRTLGMRLQALNLPLPPRVLLIRTTGREEEGEAHTRSHAVVLPARSTGRNAEELLALVAHELFHVMTRHDRHFREAAYRLIGFRLCREIGLPPELDKRRITNPDAPRVDSYIEVNVNSNAVAVAPLLLARAHFSLQRGVALHDYWQLRFLALTPIGPDEMQPVVANGEPVLYRLEDLEDFMQQVGSNTQYLIHPEEILADNFALLVTGGAAAEPERLARLESLLRSPR
jgi:hypothetical protein